MTTDTEIYAELLEDESAAAMSKVPTPIRFPVSGRYAALPPNLPPQSLPSPRPRGTLNLDVDGMYAQHVASGTLTFGLRGRAHWIARVRQTAPGLYVGAIEYRDVVGTSFPYDAVEIRAGGAPTARTCVAKFTTKGSPQPLVLPYRWVSPYFRQAEFEYDHIAGIQPVIEIDPTAHPNHPSTLKPGHLSIEELYRRAGVEARISPNPTAIPIDTAGQNATWSDAEMHDAMQAYWSRFANRPQWALWVLFANRHDMGSGLGGIMFDSIGPNHRQGTALFYNSFISQPPANDPNPAAWVARMRFWTAVHEMGHAFNLAHSWQKALGTPWLPLQNEPEARSPMNYPYRVQGGEKAFFADFAYRFSDPELLFIRHAPERFVEMGAADWFDHHAFEQAEEADPELRLEIRTRPERQSYEFLEPIVIELKLTNTSTDPKLVPDRVLDALEGMTVVVKRHGAPARQVLPLAHRCFQPRTRALEPGESIYESLFVSFGLGGWTIDQPGSYRIQVAFHLDSGEVVSNPLALRVEPPADREDERYAQNFFSEEVGRVLAFDGSLELVGANDVLKEGTKRLKARAIATHAAVALGVPSTRPSKRLFFEPADARAAGGEMRGIAVNDPNEKIVAGLAGTLATDAALTTLGHIDVAYYLDRVTDAFELLGMPERAHEVQAALVEKMKARKVTARALQRMTARRDALAGKGRKAG